MKQGRSWQGESKRSQESWEPVGVLGSDRVHGGWRALGRERCGGQGRGNPGHSEGRGQIEGPGCPAKATLSRWRSLNRK